MTDGKTSTPDEAKVRRTSVNVVTRKRYTNVLRKRFNN